MEGSLTQRDASSRIPQSDIDELLSLLGNIAGTSLDWLELGGFKIEWKGSNLLKIIDMDGLEIKKTRLDILTDWVELNRFYATYNLLRNLKEIEAISRLAVFDAIRKHQRQEEGLQGDDDITTENDIYNRLGIRSSEQEFKSKKEKWQVLEYYNRLGIRSSEQEFKSKKEKWQVLEYSASCRRLSNYIACHAEHAKEVERELSAIRKKAVMNVLQKRADESFHRSIRKLARAD